MSSSPHPKSQKPSSTSSSPLVNPVTINYGESGVNVEAGDALVDWLQSESKPQPHQNRIVSGIGGFASLFRADFPEMKKPCLVTCTDGVGTKVKLASQFGRFEEVAQDCVAMCVNDLICTGGKPLLFLDYYATGKLDLSAARGFLQGIKKACEESLCALVGGETAEMPGVYSENDFDCAGFAVGVVDEDKALGAKRVQKGDRLLGISSSGFHSNGYSLLRKVFAADLEQWKEVLLKPTALYVKLVLETLQACEVHAAAHITGGGVENIPRVLPDNLKWRKKDWEFPAIFKEVQKRTQMSDDEMRKTLNCGIGFVLILPEISYEKADLLAKKYGHITYDLGVLE
jgi:phosphoribosylformylglycinamidine cyclo-ligase